MRIHTNIYQGHQDDLYACLDFSILDCLWRKEGDSNPRVPKDRQLSKLVQSTTLPSFRLSCRLSDWAHHSFFPAPGQQVSRKLGCRGRIRTYTSTDRALTGIWARASTFRHSAITLVGARELEPLAKPAFTFNRNGFTDRQEEGHPEFYRRER